MKRYTLRMLIHDARIFNRLRLEYRRKDLFRLDFPLLDWNAATRTGLREMRKSEA